jgi:hypothetical protein
MSDTPEHVHELIDRLPPTQLTAVEGLLEAMIHDHDELTEEDRRAVAASREYFQKGGTGIPFEQVVTDLGFTMDQVGGHKRD